LRRKFLIELWSGLTVVWPIVSGLLLIMALCGVAIGRAEGWPRSFARRRMTNQHAGRAALLAASA